jgi:hypothetical protein
LCQIRDKITEYKFKKKKGLLISFDRVNHNFLLDMRQILQNSFSKVLLNGNLFDDIQISTSVRQAEPFSMLLFTVYLDTLLQKISQICNDTTDMITVYSEDITVIVDSSDEVNEIRQIFEQFEAVSGARLNLTKTVGMQIGEFPVA